jgi:excisionase family DNA binding protein
MVEQSKAKTIYTTHEVSRLLQVNPRSVINWIEQSLLPSYRTPGGHRRIRRDDLLAFLKKHQIPTPAALVDGTFSVLIVDDEQEVSGMLKAFFQKQGDYEVSLASDGITALMEVGRLKPDLLILDIMLPGLDGIEVCKQIQRDRNVPVLMLTARDSEADLLVGLGVGADDYVRKPFSPKLLEERVEELLARRSR